MFASPGWRHWPRPSACSLLAGVLFYKKMFKNKYLRSSGVAGQRVAA
jgi:hypothetical protein